MHVFAVCVFEFLTSNYMYVYVFVSTLGYVFQVRRAKCPLLLLLLYSDRIGYSTESDKKTRRLFNRIKTWRHIKILALDNELTCMYTVWFVRAKRRMDGEDVYGSPISVSTSTEEEAISAAFSPSKCTY